MSARLLLSTQYNLGYDDASRISFIAESDPGGGVKREYLYLGDIPVGVVQ